MAIYSYRTIQSPSEGFFKDKGSRFLAFAYPVTTEGEVKERLQFLRKKYFDARHQGYAYVLGPEKQKFRAYDDGEPNHSTGDPILGQIRSKDLTDTLIVVVRYFGGVKLGVSGLIAAYRAAAADALSNAVLVEREVTAIFGVEFDFSATPEVMKLVKEYDLGILSQEYGEKGTIKLEVPLRVEELVRNKIALLKATGSALTIS